MQKMDLDSKLIPVHLKISTDNSGIHNLLSAMITDDYFWK